MDDKKYFKLTENNVVGYRYFYSADSAAAPPKVNFQYKTKDDDLDGYIFQRCFRDHKSKQAVNQETYLKECINKRLLL